METAAVILIVTIFEVTGVVALALWEKSMAWVVDFLFVWLQDNLPKLAQASSDTLKLAFTVIKKSSEGLLRGVRAAWMKIRPFLIQLTVNFQKEASTWFKIIRSKVAKVDDTNRQPFILATEVKEQIEFCDMPADVREAVIRGTEKDLQIDVKELRNRELEMVN